MNTPAYDGVFLAPESIVSDPSAFHFLKTGRGGCVDIDSNPHSCGRNHPHGGVLGRLRRLAARMASALQQAIEGLRFCSSQPRGE